MKHKYIARCLRLAAVGVALSLPFVGWRAHVVGVRAQQQQQSGPPVATVEQTRKNIQVLKGLPDAQLFPLMNFINASLGVGCNYCHVKGADDRWVWESDDKPEKTTARRMMRMTMELNKNYAPDFHNNNVTCYTCHAGRTEPLNLPALPLLVVAPGHEPGNAPLPANAATTTTGAKSAARPTVEQVLDKYAAAVGSGAAIANARSTTLRGTLEASQGRTPALEITIKSPDKYLAVLTTKEQGIVMQWTNGAGGWVKTDKGTRQMSAAELTQFKAAALIYAPIKLDLAQLKAMLPQLRLSRPQKLGDRDAYVIRVRHTNGDGERFYFDAQTGLLLRRYTLTNTLLSPLPEQVDYEDYRAVDGVMLPFTIRVSSVDTFNSATRRFTEIKHNLAVDDARFAPPTQK